MRLFSLLSVPSKAITSFAKWANKPLILEEKKDFKRITEYGLWREVTLGSKDHHVYEGFTDKKHILIYEGNSLILDPKTNDAFKKFQNALKCLVEGDRNAIKDTHKCFDERFPQKPNNTIVLYEDLDSDKRWIAPFLERSGKLSRLPTFQDAATEMLNHGEISDYAIRNLLIVNASHQSESSGLLDIEPQLLSIRILPGIDAIIKSIKDADEKQYIRSHHFRNLLSITSSGFEGRLSGALDNAQETYKMILERANQMRAEKIKEALNDSRESILILTDKDHRDAIISNEIFEQMKYRKYLNGEIYKGHNLITQFDYYFW